MMWIRTGTGRRFLWTICAAFMMLLSTTGWLPAVQTPRTGIPPAEEVRCVKVWDGNTGISFTIQDMEQIRLILRCLPKGRKIMNGIPNDGFLLEFVCRGGQGTVRYVLSGSLPSRYAGYRRYCEEYLRYLESL